MCSSDLVGTATAVPAATVAVPTVISANRTVRVAILASNFKTNIDDAFVRRFQSVVQFPMPRPPERLRIWREAFPRPATLDARIDLGRIADKYELSGGTIMNVVRYASLMAVSRGDVTIALDDVEEGVRREFVKEGRAL